ncbi:MAG: 16S rRNA (cytidine(1402)-2'-O)-methyltransferase [Actinomycetota bacterium]
MTIGSLILVGTPIGNLDDMSGRAVQALKDADVIACEDTRRTRKLLTHFNVKASELFVYNDINERAQAQRLIERATRGDRIALVSDAGMPGIADPGYRVVVGCIEAGVPIDVVPGPSAAIAALAVSGLPTDRFVFEGFLPRKGSHRSDRIEALVAEDRTIVLYESPHRVESSLEELAGRLGSRRAALARELTKLYGEVRRGTLNELLGSVRESPVRGEVVIVIEGNRSPATKPTTKELAALAKKLMSDGLGRKEAMSEVAHAAGVPRKVVFDALIDEE